MKAAVFYGKGDLRIEELAVPETTKDQVLIRVRACGQYECFLLIVFMPVETRSGGGEPYAARPCGSHGAVQLETPFSAQAQIKLEGRSCAAAISECRQICVIVKLTNRLRIRCFPCRFTEGYVKITKCVYDILIVYY